MIDLWWAWPLLVLGLGVLLREAWRETSWQFGSARGQLAFLAACLAMPTLLLALPKQVPFARTLTPLLPLWFAAVALLIAAALRLLAKAKAGVTQLAVAGICLALFLTGSRREASGAGYSEFAAKNDKPQQLYHLYYHHDFRPVKAVAELHELAKLRPTIIFTDNSDLWAISWNIRTRYGGRIGMPGTMVIYYRSERLSPETLARLLPGKRLLILTRGSGQAQAILNHVKTISPPQFLSVGAPREISNTGYFKIYECPRE